MWEVNSLGIFNQLFCLEESSWIPALDSNECERILTLNRLSGDI